jgi:hypothetical protein
MAQMQKRSAIASGACTRLTTLTFKEQTPVSVVFKDGKKPARRITVILI